MKVREMSQIVVRLPAEDWEWLIRKAGEQERSRNWMVGRLIKEAREKDEQNRQA